jgi:hypothetical protein
MYLYEIVFEHPSRKKEDKDKSGKSIVMAQTSLCLASETSELIIEHAKQALKDHPDYELMGIIRRHPILGILKEEKEQNVKKN